MAPSVMTKGYGGGMADHEDWTPGDVASMVAVDAHLIPQGGDQVIPQVLAVFSF